MLSVSSNMNEVISAELAKLSRFDAMSVCRAQAVETVEMFRKRIHQEGKASDGSQIGTYSPGYMKVRTGNYGNSSRVSRGQNKGKPKNAGVYVRGAKKGIPRLKYNRTGDTMVILSLTRQMENDMMVIPVDNGYGVGYNNPLNFQKAGWAEETYSKKIFSPTLEERTKVLDIAQQAIDNALA
jgi:hypothetical protein